MEEGCFLGLGSFFLHLHYAEGHAGGELAVNRQVDGVVARFFKTQALEVHDQVAGEEGSPFRESGNREIDLDGHTFLVQRRAVGINDAQAQFVRAFVFRSEADAQGNGADGMHDWELAGNQGVKTALDAELALCRMMQKICRTLTDGIEMNIPRI